MSFVLYLRNHDIQSHLDFLIVNFQGFHSFVHFILYVTIWSIWVNFCKGQISSFSPFFCLLMGRGMWMSVASATIVCFNHLLKTFIISFFLVIKSQLTLLCAQLLSRVRLFATPRAVAHQALMSTEIPRKNPGVVCHSTLGWLY